MTQRGGAPGLGARLRELGPAMLWHRRLLAAGLTAAAVAVGLGVLAPDPPPTLNVLAAARDLGITGVPCFVAARKVAVPGAVPPDALAQFLAQILAEADASRPARDEDEDEDD